MTRKKNVIKFGQCVAEDFPIEIWFDYELPHYARKKYNCPHLKDNKLKVVIVGTNEGGFNCSIICWECLKEKMKRLENAKI